MRAGYIDRTIRMLLDTDDEIFASAIEADHPYRVLAEHLDFVPLIEPLRKLYKSRGNTGYPAEQGIKMLLVQFWEDLSDRQMERGLKENLAYRWFCGFGLRDKTPDHSYFGRVRDRMGTKGMADLFNAVNQQLIDKGFFGDVFTFIDSSMLVTKIALWNERDKAITDGYEKLNNQVVMRYAVDKDARWGAKSKHKIWFGYKRHDAIDMRYGLIAKTGVTPANVPDYQMVESLSPKQGMVFMDKGYDYPEADNNIRARAAVPATIRKKTSKIKNYDLDRWRTRVRMPFEGTFSRLTKRTKYRGQSKVAFQNFVESTVYNLKKMVRIITETQPPPNVIQVQWVYSGINSIEK